MRGSFCEDNPAFAASGGFCGGAGYIISRAAMQRLLANGAPALHEVYDESRWPNDMTTSCQLRKHEVGLELGPNMYGSPMTKIVDFENLARSHFLSSHYVRPAVMRWLHAEVGGMPDSVKKPLEELAFDHGCAVGMNVTHWNMEWQLCQGTMGGRQHLDFHRAALANLKPEEPNPFDSFK